MEFSDKYHEDLFPERYATKHASSASRRLNDRREQRLLRRCLARAGNVTSVADIGCGPGRFWATLAGDTATDACFALDISEAMLAYARRSQPPAVARRFRLAAGSVLALPFADASIDCVASMRLLHHFGDSASRRQVLGELGRVARHSVIVSLWTDGNYKAWRRGRLEARRPDREYRNRYVVPRAELADDFRAAGLTPVAHYDLIPGYSQWRYYLLQPLPR